MRPNDNLEVENEFFYIAAAIGKNELLDHKMKKEFYNKKIYF